MPGPSKQALIIQPRDIRLFTELGVARVADREQAKCLGGFHSTTRANARLLALTRAGLLSRFFMGTNGVGRKALYTLSRKSAQLVGSPYQGLRRAKDELLIGDFFVHHQLRINDVYCTVKYRPIPAPGATFIRWVSFAEPLAPGLPLIPDGYFELRIRDQLLSMFVEIDLGSETRTVWRGKVRTYLRYAVTGQFAERFGDRPFRVLAITNSPGRNTSLRAATAAITEKIFWFASFDSLERDGFWSAVWQRPKDERAQELLLNS